MKISSVLSLLSMVFSVASITHVRVKKNLAVSENPMQSITHAAHASNNTTILATNTNASLPATPQVTSPTMSNTSTSVSDPCAVLVSDNKFYRVPANETSGNDGDHGIFVFTVSEGDACYNSIPADPAKVKTQISAIKHYLSSYYAFADIGMEPNPPYYSPNIDIVAELDTLLSQSQKIKTEYQLHSAIKEKLILLHDAHVSYFQKCFQEFQYLQPFELYMTPSNTIAIRRIDRFWDHFNLNNHSTFKSLNLPSFVGATVTKINGTDAKEFIQAFADRYIGVSRSSDTRFNLALPSYGQGFNGQISIGSGSNFLPRGMSESPDSLIYTIRINGSQTEKNLDVKWAGLLVHAPEKAKDIFKSGQSYYSKYCVDSAEKQSNSTNMTVSWTGRRRSISNNMLQGNVNFFELEEIETSLHINDRQRRDDTNISYTVPMLFDKYNGFYKISADTGVWMMNSFMDATVLGPMVPTARPNFDKNTWFKTTTSALVNFEKQGIKNLVIDVTPNGGGDECYALAVARYLFQDMITRKNISFGTSEIRLSPTVLKRIKEVTYRQLFDANFLDNNTHAIAPTAEDIHTLVVNNRTYTRGGKKSINSVRFNENLWCSPYVNHILDSSKNPQISKPWDPSRIRIVSNGYCGSTCAHFTRMMKKIYGVKSVTYGGKTGRKFQPTSFEGGSVYHYEEFQDETIKWAYPVMGQLPFYNTYGTDANDTAMPLEFIPEMSDDYLAGVDVLDYKAIWDGAAKLMK